MINKILAFVVAGLCLFTSLGAMVATYLLGPAVNGGPVGAIICAVIAAVITWRAPAGGKAWRRLLIASAIACLALPLAMLVFTGQMATNVTGGEAAQAGAAIGGGIASMMAGFFALFGAAILLIVGLLVGRDKKIVYVQQEATHE